MSATWTTWSTENVRPDERFAYWREGLCAHFFAITPDPNSIDLSSFQATVQLRSVGKGQVARIYGSAQSVTRTTRDIETAAADCIYIHKELSPYSRFSPVGREEFVASTGSMVLTSDIHPISNHTVDVVDHVSLVIPRALMEPVLPRTSDIFPKLIPREPGIGALLGGFLDSFLAEFDSMSAGNAESALLSLGHLAAVAYGLIPATHDLAAASAHTARLTIAKRWIEQNLHRTDLTAAVVAHALGTSVRRLHVLFEPSGISFARYVLSMKLERSRRLLQHPSHRKSTIADIAFNCGFESLATFYRAFRAAYGTSPGDLRGDQ